MTPMIDVVFLLLVFFLASASFQRPEKSLTSASAAAPDVQDQGNRPDQAPPVVQTDLSDVVIRIRRSDANVPTLIYTINNEPVESLAQLQQRMLSLIKIRADVPFVIDPEVNVPAGVAIQVYDIARASGSVSVFLVAK